MFDHFGTLCIKELSVNSLASVLHSLIKKTVKGEKIQGLLDSAHFQFPSSFFILLCFLSFVQNLSYPWFLSMRKMSGYFWGCQIGEKILWGERLLLKVSYLVKSYLSKFLSNSSPKSANVHCIKYARIRVFTDPCSPI